MKTDSELTVDDDLMVKSNRIVVLNDIQNHVISISSLSIKDYSKQKNIFLNKRTTQDKSIFS